MRDFHCHILPGVDDGAADLQESLAMLKAAKSVGITEIVCTPHARDPYFDYDAMWEAFRLLQPYAVSAGIQMNMGFEVNYSKLAELGLSCIEPLALQESGEFLLELPTRCRASDFAQYERAIFEIQARGYTVIVAHPERYLAIQEDISIAEDLVRMGCRLQASSDFMNGGRMGHAKRPAKRMFKAGLYSYICSDAHCVEHYRAYEKAMAKYGDYLHVPLF